MSNRQRSAAVGLYVVGWILLAAIGCIVLVVKTVRHLRNTGSPYLYELRMHMPRKYRREP